MRRAPSACGLARGERAGPLILLALLAGAFVPSVLLSFDLQDLVKDLARTTLASSAARSAADETPRLSPRPLLGDGGDSPLEFAAAYQASPDAGDRSDPFLSLEGLSREKPSQSLPGGHEWPPGPASSPRSPPALPALA